MGLIQKAFSDIITFSRSSNATRIGPNGLVQYAPHNLLLRSQEFDNASWSAGNVTVTANVVAAPNGTVTADKLIATAVNGTHTVTQGVSVTSGATYTISCYLKAAEETTGSIILSNSPFPRAKFNLSSGTVISAAGGGTGTIESVGNGWYRCAVSFSAPASTINAGVAVRDIEANYTGDGVSGIYAWGAQLSVGPLPLDYTPTTSAAVYGPRFDFDPVTLAARGLLIEEQRTNLFVQSNDFSTTWLTFQSAVTTNSTTAPDGTVTADTIASNTTGVSSVVYQLSVGSAATHTVSVYAKKSTSDWFQINFEETPQKIAWFNLNTGVVGTVDSGVTASIQSVGNGWYRCVSTFAMTAAKTISMGPCDADASRAVTSGKSVYLWGAQLEAGSFATSYIPTVASSVTRSADVATVNTLSPWFNATEGTLFAEHQAIYPSQGNVVASINDNSANRSVELQHRGTTPSVSFGSFTVVSGSITGQADAGTTASYNALRKWAGAYKVNDFAASQNGGAVGVDTSGAVPSGLTQMQLMAAYWSSAASTSGWLRRVAYYPRRLANAELQALTA